MSEKVTVRTTVETQNVALQHRDAFHAWCREGGIEVSEEDGEMGAAVDIEVMASVSFGRPERLHLSNGDPGWPEDPEEIELYDTDVGADILDWLDEGTIENLQMRASEEAHDKANYVPDYDPDNDF